MPKKAKKATSEVPVKKEKMAPFNAIIFDIDNVLIDTRKSYLEAIRWTIDLYLTHGRVPFFTPDRGAGSGPYLLNSGDVEEFKHLGGFNDDWDCCYGLLIYILNLKVKSRTAQDLKKAMNVPAFVKKVKTRPLGVNGMVKMLGRPSGVKIEKIGRIFQEIYLGRELFEKMEGIKAVYWKKKGLISKEKLIVRKSTFERLEKLEIPLGIATGRPRFEALYALQAFGVLKYFHSMTTIDEVKKAESRERKSLRKPHPFSLLETARKIGKHFRYVYIGDLPDDMLAAKKAGEEIDMAAVGFPSYAHDPKASAEQLLEAEPDMILLKPGDLPRLLHSPSSFAANR